MDGTRVVLGAPVHCTGDVVGEIADVLVDPADRRLTHVVVRARDDVARLVPAELVTWSPGGRSGLTLTCTEAQLLTLKTIRRFEYLGLSDQPEPDRNTDVGVEDMVAMPNYEATAFGDYVGDFEAVVGLTYDQIPKGRVELRRSSAVRSAAGERTLGHVDGFIVRAGEITHVVVEWGHLWRMRHAAIPVDAITTIGTDQITVGMSKDDLRELVV